MRALLKNYDNEQFVYVNVCHDGKDFRTPDGKIVVETNIVDISRDNRNNYVKCGGCGELVKNTPEEIEKHWKAKAKNKNCLTCKKLSEGYRKKDIKKTYSVDPQDPTKYIVKMKYSNELYCSNSWQSHPINTKASDECCMYYACKNATMYEIEDTFTKYPNLFEILPTVDMLIQKKWKLEVRHDDFMIYHHPTMTTLKARVNTKGIVYDFLINGCYLAMYSKKYDKLFYCGDSKYKTRFPYSLNVSKKDSAEIKIKELF